MSCNLTEPNGERIGAFIVLQIIRFFLHVTGNDVAAVPGLIGTHRSNTGEDVVGQRIVRRNLLNSERRITGKRTARRFPFQPAPHPIGERRNNGRFTAHRNLDKLIVADFDEDVAILDVVGKLLVVIVLFQPIIQQAHNDTGRHAVDKQAGDQLSNLFPAAPVNDIANVLGKALHTGVEERHKGSVQFAGREATTAKVGCNVRCVIERLLNIACVLHRADKFSKSGVLLDRFIGKGKDVDYSIQPTSHFIDCTVFEMVAVGKPRLWVIIGSSFSAHRLIELPILPVRCDFLYGLAVVLNECGIAVMGKVQCRLCITDEISHDEYRVPLRDQLLECAVDGAQCFHSKGIGLLNGSKPIGHCFTHVQSNRFAIHPNAQRVLEVLCGIRIKVNEIAFLCNTLNVFRDITGSIHCIFIQHIAQNVLFGCGEGLQGLPGNTVDQRHDILVATFCGLDGAVHRNAVGVGVAAGGAGHIAVGGNIVRIKFLHVLCHISAHESALLSHLHQSVKVGIHILCPLLKFGVCIQQVSCGGTAIVCGHAAAEYRLVKLLFCPRLELLILLGGGNLCLGVGFCKGSILACGCGDVLICHFRKAVDFPVQFRPKFCKLPLRLFAYTHAVYIVLVQQVGVKLIGQASLFRRFKYLHEVLIADLLAVKVILPCAANGILRRRSCLPDIVRCIHDSAVADFVPESLQLILSVDPLALKGAPVFGGFRLKGFLVLLRHFGQNLGNIFRSGGFLFRRPQSGFALCPILPHHSVNAVLRPPPVEFVLGFGKLFVVLVPHLPIVRTEVSTVLLGKCVIFRHEFCTGLCCLLSLFSRCYFGEEFRLCITPAVIHLRFRSCLLAIVSKLLTDVLHLSLCSLQLIVCFLGCFGNNPVDVGHVLGIFHEGVADILVGVIETLGEGDHIPSVIIGNGVSGFNIFFRVKENINITCSRVLAPAAIIIDVGDFNAAIALFFRELCNVSRGHFPGRFYCDLCSCAVP